MKIFPPCWPIPLLSSWLPLLLVIAACRCAAQSGLLFDDAAYAAFPQLEAVGAKNEILSPAYSLRKYCPFPQTQGEIASCVGWAVGYAALTILQAKEEGVTDRAYITDELAHSASYIYNQIKAGEDCRAGASLTDALKLLYQQGNCRARSFPNSTTTCAAQPDAGARREAARFKLPAAGYKLFEPNASSAAKVEATRLQVALGNPVVIGFSVTPVYGPLRGKSVWQPDNAVRGGHAMVVTGYDDRRRTFELMNSFGAGWGDNGFISLTYADFAEYARQGFVLRRKDAAKGRDTTITSDLPVVLSGGLSLQYAGSFRDGRPEFEPARAVYDPSSGSYRVERDDWKLDEDLFRVQAAVPRGRCAYVFSVDTEGRADSLWMMEQYPADTLVTLPSRGYFQFSRPGEETLCLLISYEVIEGFSDRLRSLRRDPAVGIGSPIRAAFSDVLIDPSAVAYDQEAPAARGVSRYGAGIAAPVIVVLSLRE